MFTIIYEHIKQEFSYIEKNRLRKALELCNYSSNESYDELLLELMSGSRTAKDNLLERIKIAYREVK